MITFPTEILHLKVYINNDSSSGRNPVGSFKVIPVKQVMDQLIYLGQNPGIWECTCMR